MSDAATPAATSATPFDRLGGIDAVRRLVDTFYDRMDARPDCAPLRAMHPADLATSRDKLAWYLSGWLGGPNVYVEKFGHPMLRARHLPFAIGVAERDQWLACMADALERHVADLELREALTAALARLADHMRNRREP